MARRKIVPTGIRKREAAVKHALGKKQAVLLSARAREALSKSVWLDPATREVLKSKKPGQKVLSLHLRDCGKGKKRLIARLGRTFVRQPTVKEVKIFKKETGIKLRKEKVGKEVFYIAEKPKQ